MIDRYISTDHKTFCIKHREHSAAYSLCPVCFEESMKRIDELEQENKKLKEELVDEVEKWKGENESNVWLCRRRAGQIESLRRKCEIYEKALKKMADEDYRGNRSQHSVDAFKALEEGKK